MPAASSLRKLAESLRSLPETVCPIAASTVAIALMPAPPTPTMWMWRGRERSTTSATRVLLHQGGDSIGGVEMGVRAHRGLHDRAARRVVEEGAQLALETLGGELAVGHDDRRAGVGQHAAVG